MNSTQPRSPRAGVQQVLLASIETNAASQARVQINNKVVHEYELAMRQQIAEGGLRFPAIVLFSAGRKFWVGDGFHRVLAARLAGLKEFPAEVRQGNQRDALLFSITSNSEHGLQRTNADKRKAVTLLLSDAEWSQWSDREIGRRCGVSDRFIGKLRRGASANGSQMRKVRRGQRIYQMQTPAPAPSAESTASESARQHRPPTSADTTTTDALGIPIPEPRREVFVAAAEFQTAKMLHTQLAAVIERIAKSSAGEHYRRVLKRNVEGGDQKSKCGDLEASYQKLLSAEPYCCYCPLCQLAHLGWSHPDCKSCHGQGWTTQVAFRACPEGYQEQILRLKP